MARTVKANPVKRTKPGYIVEEFDSASSGFGNLEGLRMSGIQAIKRFCCECQGGHYYDWRASDGTVTPKTMPYDDVEACAATTCYLYPFRMGKNPNHTGRKTSATENSGK